VEQSPNGDANVMAENTASRNPFADNPATDYVYAQANPRRLSMGLDLNNTGRVQQIMQGPLGVDVDNDGEVDVVITPEQLRAFALQHGTAVTAAGKRVLSEQPIAAAPRRVSRALEVSPSAPPRATPLSSALLPQPSLFQVVAPAVPPIFSSYVVVAPPVYLRTEVIPQAPAPMSVPHAASVRFAPSPAPMPVPHVAAPVAAALQNAVWATPAVTRPPAPLEKPVYLKRPEVNHADLPEGVTVSTIQRKAVADHGPAIFPYHEPLRGARAGFVEWWPESHCD